MKMEYSLVTRISHDHLELSHDLHRFSSIVVVDYPNDGDVNCTLHQYWARIEVCQAFISLWYCWALPDVHIEEAVCFALAFVVWMKLLVC